MGQWGATEGVRQPSNIMSYAHAGGAQRGHEKLHPHPRGSVSDLLPLRHSPPFTRNSRQKIKSITLKQDS